VAFEPGLIDALAPGATWIDMTTTDPDLVGDLGRRAHARRIDVVDAPVTGAVDGARTGRLRIFVGGAEPVVEKVRPYLEVLGRIIPCGALATATSSSSSPTRSGSSTPPPSAKRSCSARRPASSSARSGRP
jgi:3-hydroxyisobutyrate dehydrogenase-like beta-hydroxyacid dehydrogenase